MNTWKEVIVKVVDYITEDKIMAILSLTILGYWTIHTYPGAEGLPVVTAIVGGIAGFVAGAGVKHNKA